MTATVAGPLELTRTRMQSGSEGQNNAFQVMRQIVSQRGVKSLWSGLLPTLWRDAPFSAIYWYSYEALKARDGKHCSGNTQEKIELSFDDGN